MNTILIPIVSLRIWAATWICLGAIVICTAHDPGLSTVSIRMHPHTVEAVMVLSLKDAEALRDATPSTAKAPAAFAAAAQEALQLQCNQRSVTWEVLNWSFDGASNATVQLRAQATEVFTLRIQSQCFESLPSGHRQFITVHGARNQLLAEKLLSAKSDTLDLELKNAESHLSPASGTIALDFFRLGVKHILSGYDHLLFLFSLLLVVRKIGPTLKIITAFTVAHSITLAVAALNVVRVPASIVEPIIAASIVYVGVENLIRGEMPKGRVLLTFVFGLIHGLGFATALREAGLGAHGTGIAAPLVLFNLGVELGQLLVAAAALPLIWTLNAQPALSRRCVPACSALVVIAGSCWFVQRIWEQ